jgi:hypothetical protein
VAGFDDYLIGNRQGLERLKAAIDEALESDSGESNTEIGDIIGIKCWSDEDLAERDPTPVQQAIGCSFGLLTLLTFGAGVVAIAYWIFG